MPGIELDVAVNETDTNPSPTELAWGAGTCNNHDS